MGSEGMEVQLTLPPGLLEEVPGETAEDVRINSWPRVHRGTALQAVSSLRVISTSATATDPLVLAHTLAGGPSYSLQGSKQLLKDWHAEMLKKTDGKFQHAIVLEPTTRALYVIVAVNCTTRVEPYTKPIFWAYATSQQAMQYTDRLMRGKPNFRLPVVFELEGTLVARVNMEQLQAQIVKYTGLGNADAATAWTRRQELESLKLDQAMLVDFEANNGNFYSDKQATWMPSTVPGSQQVWQHVQVNSNTILCKVNEEYTVLHIRPGLHAMCKDLYRDARYELYIYTGATCKESAMHAVSVLDPKEQMVTRNKVVFRRGPSKSLASLLSLPSSSNGCSAMPLAIIVDAGYEAWCEADRDQVVRQISSYSISEVALRQDEDLRRLRRGVLLVPLYNAASKSMRKQSRFCKDIRDNRQDGAHLLNSYADGMGRAPWIATLNEEGRLTAAQGAVAAPAAARRGDGGAAAAAAAAAGKGTHKSDGKRGEQLPQHVAAANFKRLRTQQQDRQDSVVAPAAAARGGDGGAAAAAAGAGYRSDGKREEAQPPSRQQRPQPPPHQQQQQRPQPQLHQQQPRQQQAVMPGAAPLKEESTVVQPAGTRPAVSRMDSSNTWHMAGAGGPPEEEAVSAAPASAAAAPAHPLVPVGPPEDESFRHGLLGLPPRLVLLPTGRLRSVRVKEGRLKDILRRNAILHGMGMPDQARPSITTAHEAASALDRFEHRLLVFPVRDGSTAEQGELVLLHFVATGGTKNKSGIAAIGVIAVAPRMNAPAETAGCIEFGDGAPPERLMGIQWLGNCAVTWEDIKPPAQKEHFGWKYVKNGVRFAAMFVSKMMVSDIGGCWQGLRNETASMVDKAGGHKVRHKPFVGLKADDPQDECQIKAWRLVQLVQLLVQRAECGQYVKPLMPGLLPAVNQARLPGLVCPDLNRF